MSYLIFGRRVARLLTVMCALGTGTFFVAACSVGAAREDAKSFDAAGRCDVFAEAMVQRSDTWLSSATVSDEGPGVSLAELYSLVGAEDRSCDLSADLEAAADVFGYRPECVSVQWREKSTSRIPTDTVTHWTDAELLEFVFSEEDRTFAFRVQDLAKNDDGGYQVDRWSIVEFDAYDSTRLNRVEFQSCVSGLEGGRVSLFVPSGIDQELRAHVNYVLGLEDVLVTAATEEEALGVVGLTTVANLSLFGPGVNSTVVQTLAEQLPGIRHLRFDGASLEFDAMEAIAALQYLAYFELQRGSVSDAGLRLLLEKEVLGLSLDLRNTPVDPETLAALRKLYKVRR